MMIAHATLITDVGADVDVDACTKLASSWGSVVTVSDTPGMSHNDPIALAIIHLPRWINK